MSCTEIMSVIDTEVQTCILCSGMENKGWNQGQSLAQVVPRSHQLLMSVGRLYTTYILQPTSFTRSCDLLEKYIYCPLLDSDCTYTQLSIGLNVMNQQSEPVNLFKYQKVPNIYFVIFPDQCLAIKNQDIYFHYEGFKQLI